MATSTALVALAEVGDKTQLLAIFLVARFRRPWPIIAGILAATITNHFLAALLGSQIAAALDADWFAYLVALSFIVMAGWTLVADEFDDKDARLGRFGPFATTLVSFFLVEMGDKTQLATVALAARFNEVAAVTMGTTLGMMIANVPAVLIGGALLRRIPLKAMRLVAAALFAATGLWLAVQAATG